MLFDTDSGSLSSHDLGDAKAAIRTTGVGSNFYVSQFTAPINNLKWTFSCGVRRTVLGVATSIFGTGTTLFDVNQGNIGFDTSNRLIFYTSTGYWSFITNRIFVDTSAWMYVQVIYDSAQAVAANRVKIYINGVQELDFNTATYPTLNRASTIGQVDRPHQIGFNGEVYLTSVAFIDGESFDPSYFGAKSTVYNEWRAIPQSDQAGLCTAYGQSSFFLDFRDSSTIAALGTDTSGHGNNWTVASYALTGATTNIYKEGPGDPYPTLGLMDPANTSTLSIGSLRYTGAASISQSRRCPKRLVGKVYIEVTVVSATTLSGVNIGVTDRECLSYPGGTATSYGWTLSSGNIKNNATTFSSRSFTGAVGNTFMLAIDTDAGVIYQGVNGAWYGSTVPPANPITLTLMNDSTYDGWFFVVGSTNTCVLDINFGQRPFTYSVPAGFDEFKALNDPPLRIYNPNEHFDVLSGTGVEIKSLADARYGGNCIELIKDRANVNSWQFMDTARGLTIASPFPHATSMAEGSYAQPSGASIVYVFNTATPAVTNNVGNKSSVVSANDEAGISAVAYQTGNFASFGHGLSNLPTVMLAKLRQAASDPQGWGFCPDNNGNFKLAGRRLNSTASAYNGSVSGNTTYVTLSSGNNDANYYAAYGTGVAYLFTESRGFCKAAYYTGNGLTDGPFVWLGFKPKLVIIKRDSATAGNWTFTDSVRSPGNYANESLSPNSTAAEVVTSNTTGAYLTLLTNGFKVNSSHADVNTSAVSYWVLAFADVAETYALAR